jgi:hypothetical protein
VPAFADANHGGHSCRDFEVIRRIDLTTASLVEVATS